MKLVDKILEDIATINDKRHLQRQPTNYQKDSNCVLLAAAHDPNCDAYICVKANAMHSVSSLLSRCTTCMPFEA